MMMICRRVVEEFAAGGCRMENYCQIGFVLFFLLRYFEPTGHIPIKTEQSQISTAVRALPP